MKWRAHGYDAFLQCLRARAWNAACPSDRHDDPEHRRPFASFHTSSDRHAPSANPKRVQGDAGAEAHRTTGTAFVEHRWAHMPARPHDASGSAFSEAHAEGYVCPWSIVRTGGELMLRLKRAYELDWKPAVWRALMTRRNVARSRWCTARATRSTTTQSR
jgi:hypothetical protein